VLLTGESTLQGEKVGSAEPCARFAQKRALRIVRMASSVMAACELEFVGCGSWVIPDWRPQRPS